MTTLQNILAESPWIASTLLAALLLLARSCSHSAYLRQDGLTFPIVLILFNRRRSALRGNTLLLVGAPNAGKTAILTTVCSFALDQDTCYQRSYHAFSLPIT